MFKLFVYKKKKKFFLFSHFESGTKSAIERLHPEVPDSIYFRGRHLDQPWLGADRKSFHFMMTNSSALSFYTMSRLWEDSASQCCETFFLSCLSLAHNTHARTHTHIHTNAQKLSVIFHQICSYTCATVSNHSSQMPHLIHSGTQCAKSTYTRLFRNQLTINQ